MTRARLLLVLVIALLPCAVHAYEEADKAKGTEFDKRMFAVPLGAKTTYACFVRTYDAEHLARHPEQRRAAMTFLGAAGKVAEDKTDNYSSRLAVKYRHRPCNFDSSGSCNHVFAED